MRGAGRLHAYVREPTVRVADGLHVDRVEALPAVVGERVVARLLPANVAGLTRALDGDEQPVERPETSREHAG
jgi:hypothetical protein